MYPTPFLPIWGNAGLGSVEMAAPVVISASTTSSSATALPGNSNGDGGNASISIENESDHWAYSNFGDANVADATASNGVGCPPNSVRVIAVSPLCTHVKVILATGATGADVRYLRGSGL